MYLCQFVPNPTAFSPCRWLCVRVGARARAVTLPYPRDRGPPLPGLYVRRVVGALPQTTRILFRFAAGGWLVTPWRFGPLETTANDATRTLTPAYRGSVLSLRRFATLFSDRPRFLVTAL